MQIINKRYGIIKQINFDSEGRVLKVEDFLDEYKLYRLRTVYFSEEDFSFTKVGDRLASYMLFKHPNLLTLKEFNLVSNPNYKEPSKEFFYITEYYDEDRELDYLYLNNQEKLYVIERIIYGLRYLHFKKIVYKYLSFKNLIILREEDGSITVKLRDLASVDDDINKQIKENDRNYMFIAGERELDQNSFKSDIYSLAKMIYYIINSIDYRTENLQNTQIKSDNSALSDLIAISTHSDLNKRPDNLDVFWKELAKIIDISTEFDDIDYYSDLSRGTSFVAHRSKRDQVLNIVNDYFKDSTSLSTVFIKAGTGIGKSYFLADIEKYLKLNSCFSTRVIAEESKGDKFPVFTKVLRNILENVTIPYTIIEKFASDLLIIVPEFQEKWGIKPSVIEDKYLEQNRVISRYIEIIKYVSANNKYAIFIDNVDKLEEDDLFLLINLIDCDYDYAPFLLLSVNDLPAVFHDNGLTDKNFVLELEPFNYHETVIYLKNLLSLEEESKPLAKLLSSLAHGNPSNIRRIIQNFYEQKQIYISSDRKWVVDKIDLEKYSFQKSEAQTRYKLEKILELSNDAISLAKRLACYGVKVDVFFALQFSDLKAVEFNNAITELLDNEIIIKTRSDWGNYYEFYNEKLMNAIYHTMTQNEKYLHHTKSAESYEESLDNQIDSVFESYVYHLIRSVQVEKAVKILSERASKKLRYSLLTEALEYFEYAYTISDFKKDPKVHMDLLDKISKINIRLLNIELALSNYVSMMNKSEETGLDEYFLRACFMQAKIYIFQRKVRKADAVFKILNQKLKKTNDIQSKLAFLLIELEYAKQFSENHVLKERVEKLKEISLEEKNNYYLAKSIAYDAEYDLEEENFSQAEYKAAHAIRLFEQIKTDEEEKIMPYILLGVINSKHVKNFSKAEESFERAKSILEFTNTVWTKIDLLISYGSYLQSIGEYSNAKNSFIQAEQFAINTGQIDGIMISTIRLMDLSLNTEDYVFCYQQMEKYEDLFSDTNEQVRLSYYYYFKLLQAELHMFFRNFNISRKIILDIRNNGLIHMDSYEKFRFFVSSAMYDYESFVYHIGEFDIESIKYLYGLCVIEDEKTLLKDLLLNIAIHSFAVKKREIFDEIMLVLMALTEDEENKNYRVKFNFLDSLRTQNADKLRVFINQMDPENLNYIWKMHMIMGDLYFSENKKLEAILSYIEAREHFYLRLAKIPFNYRETCVRKDELLERIQIRIRNLKKELYPDMKDTDQDAKALEDTKVLTSDLKSSILRDKEYKAYKKKIYENTLGISVSTFPEYISTLGEDTEQNVRNLLIFLTQYLSAENGILYILGESGEITETYKTTEDAPDFPVLDYVSKLDNQNKFIINEKNDKLLDGISSINTTQSVLFKVQLKEQEDLSRFRRRADIGAKSKKTIAYVYISSTMIVNDISKRKLNRILNYEGLASTVINNHLVTKNATMDKLTGTYIRNVVKEKLNKIINSGSKRINNFSLLMLDIDHFKAVNDTYGHMVGDKVLTALGKTLNDSLRKKDIVGRYGGEEFIVVLNGTEKQAAMLVAEKLRRNVEKANFLGKEKPVTISVGISSYPQDGRNMDLLVEKADKALYYSKNNGRNMVSIYDEKMGTDAKRYDQLAGVLTYNSSENSRNIKVILNIISILSKKKEKRQKINEIFSLILDIIPAKEVGIIKENGLIRSKKASDDTIYSSGELSENAIKTIKSLENGACFVDWDLKVDEKENYKIPNWRTYLSSRLVHNGEKRGYVYLMSNIKDKEYNSNEHSFLSVVAPLIAVLIDDDFK